MASKNLFKSQKSLIVPYGLRSWLGCVCRAVLLEDPTNVIEFIFDYCTGLLNFRSENPFMDVRDLTYMYQKTRGELQEIMGVSPSSSMGKIPTEKLIPVEVVPHKTVFHTAPLPEEPLELTAIAVDASKESLAEDTDQIKFVGLKISDEASFEETINREDHTMFSAVVSSVGEAERITQGPLQKITSLRPSPSVEEAEEMSEDTAQKVASLRTSPSVKEAEDVSDEAPQKITSPRKSPSLEEAEDVSDETPQKITSPRKSPSLEEAEEVSDEAPQKITSPRKSPSLQEAEDVSDEAPQKITSPRKSPSLEEAEEVSDEAPQKITSPRKSPSLEEAEEVSDEAPQKITSPRKSPSLEEAEEMSKRLKKSQKKLHRKFQLQEHLPV
ncbi:titin-like [Arapaima gigas]